MPLTRASGLPCPGEVGERVVRLPGGRHPRSDTGGGDMMETITSIVIRDSRLEPSAVCIVCGGDIPAGEGLTARHGDRILRFKCSG